MTISPIDIPIVIGTPDFSPFHAKNTPNAIRKRLLTNALLLISRYLMRYLGTRNFGAWEYSSLLRTLLLLDTSTTRKSSIDENKSNTQTIISAAARPATAIIPLGRRNAIATPAAHIRTETIGALFLYATIHITPNNAYRKERPISTPSSMVSFANAIRSPITIDVLVKSVYKPITAAYSISDFLSSYGIAKKPFRYFALSLDVTL